MQGSTHLHRSSVFFSFPSLLQWLADPRRFRCGVHRTTKKTRCTRTTLVAFLNGLGIVCARDAAPCQTVSIEFSGPLRCTSPPHVFSAAHRRAVYNPPTFLVSQPRIPPPSSADLTILCFLHLRLLARGSSKLPRGYSITGPCSNGRNPPRRTNRRHAPRLRARASQYLPYRKSRASSMRLSRSCVCASVGGCRTQCARPVWRLFL